MGQAHCIMTNRKKNTHRKTIIKIQRRGGIDNDSRIESAARTIIDAMFSRRMANTLRITIKLRATIQNTSKGTLGLAEFRDTSKGKTARSKHYTIQILRDMPLERQLSTLIHELKHIEQFTSGRLTVRETYKVIGWFWRYPGQTGQATKYPLGSIAWEKRPWEVEACKAQNEFAHLLNIRTRRDMYAEELEELASNA
jgi:hypothetical protein